MTQLVIVPILLLNTGFCMQALNFPPQGAQLFLLRKVKFFNSPVVSGFALNIIETSQQDALVDHGLGAPSKVSNGLHNFPIELSFQSCP